MFYFRSIQMKHKVKQSLCNTKTGSNSCFSWSWSAFHVCLSEFSVWNKGKFVAYCYLLSLLVCWIQSLFSVCLEGLKESSERIYKLSAADQLLLLSLLHWNINWIFSAHSSVDFAVIWLEGGGGHLTRCVISCFLSVVFDWTSLVCSCFLWRSDVVLGFFCWCQSFTFFSHSCTSKHQHNLSAASLHRLHHHLLHYLILLPGILQRSFSTWIYGGKRVFSEQILSNVCSFCVILL